jgi:hypothetical protein
MYKNKVKSANSLLISFLCPMKLLLIQYIRRNGGKNDEY